MSHKHTTEEWTKEIRSVVTLFAVLSDLPGTNRDGRYFALSDLDYEQETGADYGWHYSSTGVAERATERGVNQASHNGGVERYYVTG